MKRNLEKWKKIKCGGCARYVRMPSCGREGGSQKKSEKSWKKIYVAVVKVERGVRTFMSKNCN